MDGQEEVLLFHAFPGDRVSSFQIDGVFPPWFANELWPSNAFYAGNSIANAFAHVVLNKPRWAGDLVMIWVFKVNFKVMIGRAGDSAFKAFSYAFDDELDRNRFFQV